MVTNCHALARTHLRPMTRRARLGCGVADGGRVWRGRACHGGLAASGGVESHVTLCWLDEEARKYSYSYHAHTYSCLWSHMSGLAGRTKKPENTRTHTMLTLTHVYGVTCQVLLVGRRSQKILVHIPMLTLTHTAYDSKGNMIASGMHGERHAIASGMRSAIESGMQ